MNWFKIFLVLISFLGNNLLFAMEEEKPPHSAQAGASPVLVTEYTHREAEPLGPKIESWTQDTHNVFLHFYWTVGRLPEMVTPDKKNLPVPIGGQDYGETFFSSVEQFLKLVPEKVTVVMTCDHWTHETNKEGFETLIEKFRERFQIKFIDDEVEKLKTLYPRHRQTIEQVFRNACCGNPAIASDIYRLVIESLHCDQILGASSVIAYSDVDVFCGSFKKEGDDLEAFMENLFNPQYTGYFSRRNDLIKFSNPTKKRTEYTANQVFSKLEEILDGRTIISHFSEVINFSEKFNKAPNEEIFTAYLRYSRNSNFCTRAIIDVTGPGFLNKYHSNFDIPRKLRTYPEIYTLTWYDKNFEISSKTSFSNGILPVTIFFPKMKLIKERMETSESGSFNPYDLRNNYDWETEEVSRYFAQLEHQFGTTLDHLEEETNEEYRELKSYLSDLGFLRNFGENHSFYIKLKSLVLSNKEKYFNPSSYFAQIINIYFNFDLSHGFNLSQEDWADIILYQIKIYDNGVHFIKKALDRLKGDFSLSQEDIIKILKKGIRPLNQSSLS